MEPRTNRPRVATGRKASSGIATALALVVAAGLAQPAFATIEEVVGLRRCNAGRTQIIDPGETQTPDVVGPWQDYAVRVRCTTANSGITCRILEKGHKRIGGRNKPYVEIRLRVPRNETPGRKTIAVTHRTPAGEKTESFRVTVPPRLITRISSRTPSDFFDQVTLNIEGNNLSETPPNLSRIEVLSGSQLRGGGSGGRIESVQWNRQSTRRGTLNLRFADLMQRADLNVSLRSTNGCFQGGTNESRHTVETTARDNNIYVQEIRPNLQNQFRTGSVVSFRVRLTRPVPASPLAMLAARRSRLPALNPGQTVYWRVLPSAAFRAADGETPLPQLERLVIPPGQQEGTIQFYIRECLNVGQPLSATLETFVGDTSATRGPEKVTRSFAVSCPGPN